MNSTDELLVIGSLDQPIPTDNDWVLKQIENIVEQAIEKNDPYIAINAFGQLYKVAKLAGLGLAKGLYLLKESWYKFNLDDETFKEMVYPKIGLHPATIDRYIETWEMLQTAAPEKVRGKLQQQNIKSLIPIAKAVKQGYSIDADEWEELADAPDFATIAQIVREDIKNKPPRKGSLTLVIDSIGTIWAMYEDDRKFVGSLEIKDEDSAVQKAIERIISNSGMIRQ